MEVPRGLCDRKQEMGIFFQACYERKFYSLLKGCYLSQWSWDMGSEIDFFG